MTDITGQPAPRITIQLIPEWGTSPLWVSVEGGVTDPYDLDEITDVVPLSKQLLADIVAWDDRLDAVYNRAVPQDSGFATVAEWEAFNEEGRELARRMQAEVTSNVSVTYTPLDGSREILEKNG
jgi:hypothetical protein